MYLVRTCTFCSNPTEQQSTAKNVQRTCVCFLPIHSGHQWTYQPGSHRRKVTQDFSSTFFLRCVPLLFLARKIQPFLSLVDVHVLFAQTLKYSSVSVQQQKMYHVLRTCTCACEDGEDLRSTYIPTLTRELFYSFPPSSSPMVATSLYALWYSKLVC